MIAREIWETGREGNGLWSPSSSSCQPGNVARRRRQMNARMMATILGSGLLVKIAEPPARIVGKYSHEIWEDNAVLERACHPDQIQWILIYANLTGQTARIVAA
jgi:hypothetical protein